MVSVINQSNLFNNYMCVTFSHTYYEIGTKKIKVIARDEHGKESDWSDSYPIEVIFNDNLNSPPQLSSYYQIFYPKNRQYNYGSLTVQYDCWDSYDNWLVFIFDVFSMYFLSIISEILFPAIFSLEYPRSCAAALFTTLTRHFSSVTISELYILSIDTVDRKISSAILLMASASFPISSDLFKFVRTLNFPPAIS